MTQYLAPIEEPTSISYISDWIELYITANSGMTSKSEISSLIEGSSGEEPRMGFIDSVWLELNRRRSLYGNKPPFTMDSQSISCSLNWKKLPEYMACLLLSVLGNAHESAKTGKLFEKTSDKAIKNFLNSDSIIYGHPAKQHLTDIACIMNERFNFSPTRNFKDRGVDIITWKPFLDNRCSQIVILFQCAAGQNWKSKTKDIPLQAWKNYIAWGCCPLQGFCIPHVIRENDFNEIAYEAGILFDRARIYRSLGQSSSPDAIQTELTTWCNERLKTLC